MNILFTHGYFLQEDKKESLIMRPYVPLGILYVSAFLEVNGYDNEIFDSTFSDFNSLIEKIRNYKPAIIAIYTNLMTKLNVLNIIRLIKNDESLKKIKIVLGGPEVKNHAQNFLMFGADIIVFGEGEATMLELVACIEQNKSYKEVEGIAFKNEQQEFITTASRSLNKEIDTRPFPNRKKIDLNLYLQAWKERHGYNAINVSTMRGCPYTCKWCSRAVYGQTYRRRKPSLVVDEIISLQKEYSFDYIWFVDDVFTISHKWLEQFAAEVDLRKVTIQYECISRADRLNEDVIKLLKKSGCFRVWIGAESGSQKIIDAMDRRVDVQQTRDMIQLVKRHGIKAGTFIMLGYPGETEKDIVETINHLKLSLPDEFTITVTYPIKGTPLYAEMEKDFLTHFPWESATDREIDFARTFPRRYYDYAVSWVVNEVNAKKNAMLGNYGAAMLCKIASYKQQINMLRWR